MRPDSLRNVENVNLENDGTSILTKQYFFVVLRFLRPSYATFRKVLRNFELMADQVSFKFLTRQIFQRKSLLR